MSSEKTEPPTPKRLQDARKKGQVPRSKELVGALTTGMVLLTGYLMYPYILELLFVLFIDSIGAMNKPFETVLANSSLQAFNIAMAIVVPIIGGVVVMTILASLAQGGFVFAFEVVKPKLENMSPAKAIKNIFSQKNLIEFIKSLIKAAALSIIIYIIVYRSLQDLLRLPHCGLDCLPILFGYLTFEMFALSTLLYLVVAIFDTVIQQAQHIKGLKMSRDEIKREYKESEGSPEIKQARQGLFQEIISESVSSGVGNSSVVVTNPTHFAIGLYYERGKTKLPVVTLKETGAGAKAAKTVAHQRRIPIYEDRKLAQKLFKTAKVNRHIPREAIVEVAGVIKWLQKIDKQKQD